MTEQRSAILRQLVKDSENIAQLQEFVALAKAVKSDHITDEIRQAVSAAGFREAEQSAIVEDLNELIRWRYQQNHITEGTLGYSALLPNLLEKRQQVAFWQGLSSEEKFQTDQLIVQYRQYLEQEGKSEKTVNSYIGALEGYLQWYSSTYGDNVPCVLLRVNALEYISYMRTVKKLKESSINTKIAALTSFDRFLVEGGIARELVFNRKDYLKSQTTYASLCQISKAEVEEFRQKILLGQGPRDYAMITIMAYAGLRVSEVVRLEVRDVDFVAGEIDVHGGKGDKARIVFINDKIERAVKEYLKIRPECDSPYLFLSREGGQLDRTRLNQICNDYSDIITPHQLRHFYCSHALEMEYTVAEVANQAGHSNPHTTLRYLNPSRKQLKMKANRL